MFDELMNELSNTSVFTDSIKSYMENISINQIIITIMMIFMVVGAIDKIRGNKSGYGEKFDEGFEAMGALASAMIGVVALAPVLRIVLQPLIAPIYEAMGASPAMFATTLLANDMGGYNLAMELAGSGQEHIGNFAGLILGSMMGPTIVFIIPVALSIIATKDRPYLASGVLVGLVTIPIGCIVGGLIMNTAGFEMDIMTIVINLIPVILISALIIVGLWFKPAAMMKGFNVFGKAINVIIVIGVALAVFQFQTGIKLPLFHVMVEENAGGITPLEEGIVIVGTISIVLLGAFPLVLFITRAFKKPLMAIGKAFGMNTDSSTGLVASLANCIPMFNIMGDMDSKGKLLNVAFAVSASFVFGDHLGFTAGVNSDMILPVIAGKLTAGVTALILANILAPKLLSKVTSGKDDEPEEPTSIDTVSENA